MKISLIACASMVAFFFCRIHFCLTACIPLGLNVNPAADMVGVEEPVAGVEVLGVLSSSLSELDTSASPVDFAASLAAFLSAFFSFFSSLRTFFSAFRLALSVSGSGSDAGVATPELMGSGSEDIVFFPFLDFFVSLSFLPFLSFFALASSSEISFFAWSRKSILFFLRFSLGCSSAPSSITSCSSRSRRFRFLLLLSSLELSLSGSDLTSTLISVSFLISSRDLILSPTRKPPLTKFMRPYLRYTNARCSICPRRSSSFLTSSSLPFSRPKMLSNPARPKFSARSLPRFAPRPRLSSFRRTRMCD
jgi:hypothetical protein